MPASAENRACLHCISQCPRPANPVKAVSPDIDRSCVDRGAGDEHDAAGKELADGRGNCHQAPYAGEYETGGTCLTSVVSRPGSIRRHLSVRSPGHGTTAATN